ncbi:YcxB family protein [Shewanella algidipiscicola]|uniref:YcxB-like C-terminal domain-containing protein n=1 Tax=Shewanella algidipiscicola TaxID=614070 RepID=A0ABQ4PDP1_9GAMM|nr:YcxB family protein [Shewanella algidipiscicola]GIU45648.1 hypothetical protein TUM4630_14260 [Shewanella algidipiscicola]
MSDPFHYTTQFTLDKAYYAECFDQSVTQDTSIKTYYKAIGFIVIGTALLLTGSNSYASWFIVGLGVLEALSVKFKRSWWLMRQMWSKAAGNETTLTIDERGISTHSYCVDSLIAWDEMYRINETDKGFLITLAKGTSYVSKSHLSTQACDFIRAKI